MQGLDVCKFIAENGDGLLSVSPLDKAEDFFNRLLEADQIICKYHKRKLIAVMVYYRCDDPDAEIKSEEEWALPKNYNKGRYVFVDQVVVHKDYRNSNVLQKLTSQIRQLRPAFHAALWLEADGKWRAEERSQNMQTNCGILAFDKIAGVLNGRANVISLSTLAKLAQDNEFLLYPMKVTREQLSELDLPYIIHHDHHFETIKDSYQLFGVDLPEEVYVLAQDFNLGNLIEDEEARKVRGSKGKKFFKQILMPAIDPFNTMAVRADANGNHYPFAGSGQALGGAAGGFLTGGPIGAIGGGIMGGLNSAKDNNNPGGLGFSDFLGGGVSGAGVGAGVAGVGSMFGGGSATTGPVTSLLKNAGGSLLGGGFGGGSGSTGGIAGGGSMGNSLGGLLGSGFGSGVGGGAGGAGGGGGFNIGSLLNKNNLSMLTGAGLLGLGLGRGDQNSSLPQGYNDLQGLATQYKQNGGLSPAAQAAQPVLVNGINAGPDGIYPASNDSYFQALQRQQRDTSQFNRENTLRDVNRLTGGPYSSEAMQIMNRFDTQQQNQEQDQTRMYLEDQRKVALQAHQNYIELAMRGDAQAFQSLAQTLGSVAEAQAAIQAYRQGVNTGLINAGTRMLGNGLSRETGQYDQAMNDQGIQ